MTSQEIKDKLTELGVNYQIDGIEQDERVFSIIGALDGLVHTKAVCILNECGSIIRAISDSTVICLTKP